jgi:hypothetical protein
MKVGRRQIEKGGKANRAVTDEARARTLFFRWKTILGEKMYARELGNQKTEAAVKAAVLNKFIQIPTPKAVKVA